MAVVGGFYSQNNPRSRVVTSASRAWVDGNGNYVPDCVLLNPAAQDNRAAGGDSCGATPGNFGQSVITTQIDPTLLSGWGVRPSDWNLMIAAQHEVLPRVSVEVGYYRRWFHGFFVTDNLNLSLSDYTQFNLIAPLDPRLPDGGGYAVGPLYDVNPDKFSTAPNNMIFSTDKSRNAEPLLAWVRRQRERTDRRVHVSRRHQHGQDRLRFLRDSRPDPPSGAPSTPIVNSICPSARSSKASRPS